MQSIAAELVRGVNSEGYTDLFFEEYMEKDYTPPLMDYNDITHKLSYQEDAKPFKTSLHIGQRKLFLTEMRFLVEHVSKDEKAVVVYAGAAPSNHTGFLSEFFPNITFILVDPSPFHIKGSVPHKLHGQQELSFADAVVALEETKNIDNRLFIINGYFTVPLAEAVRSVFDNVYFICDIRTVTKGDEFANSLDILWNLAQQFNWITAMQPKISMLKFRHPFYTESPAFFYEKSKESPYKEEFELAKENGLDFVAGYSHKELIYLDGIIQLQPWAPTISTEARLITNGTQFKNWGSLEEYEDRFFYYNNIARCFRLRENRNADRKLGFDHCNDCSMENAIWSLYQEYYDTNIEIKKCVVELSKFSKPLLSHSSYHGSYFGMYDTRTLLQMIEKHNRANGLVTVQKSRMQLHREEMAKKRKRETSRKK